MKSLLSIIILLFTISLLHFTYGDKPYKLINFKVPKEIWKKAFRPTPVQKSAVTITLPVNVQDYNDDAEDPIDDEVPEVTSENIADAEATEAPQNPISAPSIPSLPPIATVPPLLQDQTQVPGQLIRFPCDCRNRQCGCCTGAMLERINMKTCGNITFIPEDFVFDVKLNVNNRTVVRRRVSASDPPPICFNPRRAPFVQVCAEISNIQIRNRNAHACLDINANVGGFPVYSASFRCFNFGASGVQTGKKPRPIKSPGPKPVNLFGNSNSDNDDGGGGFIANTAGSIFGDGGFFQGGGGSSDDDGPFDGIGDAIGGFLDLD